MTRTNVSYRESKQSPPVIPAPYDLNAGKTDSNQFYRELEDYTSLVIKKGIDDLGDIINDFRYVSRDNSPDEEVLLDMLIIGVLWEEYAGQSIPFLKIKKAILIFLYDLRRYPSLKIFVDSLRGKLAGYWLTGFPGKDNKLTIKKLHRLELFLQASCEFREELKRSSRIIRYLEESNSFSAEVTMSKIFEFAGWFRLSSGNHLGKYTTGVRAFLHKHHKEYKGREDYFFCGRKESEYHLNMIGAEIMNRILRKDFGSTENKILLLPACMAYHNSKCRARIKKGGLTCAHCTPECNISRATMDMKQKGIRTVIIRHSSSFSKSLEPWANQRTTGLIGVACVLNLLTGGFEMRRLGIPSQCVFLDNSGCKKHWQNGKPSEINLSAACKAACIK